jgi:hypothetical protein
MDAEGDRGGIALVSILTSRVGGVWGRDLELASGERNERSEYKCRDLSKAFSERKNRTADRRFST